MQRDIKGTTTCSKVEAANCQATMTVPQAQRRRLHDGKANADYIIDAEQVDQHSKTTFQGTDGHLDVQTPGDVRSKVMSYVCQLTRRDVTGMLGMMRQI